MQQLSEHQEAVFLDRYAKKGPDGKPVESTVEEMWDRVAAAIGKDLGQIQKFRNVLDAFKFVPGGRILSGAGVGAEVTFYNCYVIPLETKIRRRNREAATTIEFENEVEKHEFRIPPIEADPGADSRESIFDTIGLMVDIMSRGGGVGINWSVLRPKGNYLKRVNGTTSGPVSWMDVASKAVGIVEQGGSRRGAAMFMLDDWHPDILEFIDAKRDFGLITNANVSVCVSDDFMSAVNGDFDWPLIFPDTGHPAYDTEWDGDIEAWRAKDYPVVVHGRVRAKELWDKLVAAAHASGEPGVVFLDRYRKMSTGREVERIISVNPCGEQGLGPYSVCNLGAMNLDAYLSPVYGGSYEFEWDKFRADVIVAVEFLDRVIDTNYYFIPENEKAQKSLRRIGLGVMGLADALAAQGLRYGNKRAVEFTERVFHVMKSAAVFSSISLAMESGPAPAWDVNMVESPFLAEFQNSPLGSQIARYGLRNIFLLTQAPTGTTSILAGVNSGIEPFFELRYTREDRTGKREIVVPALSKYKDSAVSAGPEWVTSSEVSVAEHIAMQAAVQKNIDSSVSKTINGPNWHTIPDVDEAYRLAYESGLKGIAYFRDGSGRAQVLQKQDSLQEAHSPREEIAALEEILPLVPYAIQFERPLQLTGETLRTATRAGSAFVTVNRDSTGRPVEVFVNVGHSGSDLSSMTEALGRLASLALRHGASLGGVANQLEGVGGNGNFNKAVPHAIGQALTQMNRPPPDNDDEEEYTEDIVGEAVEHPMKPGRFDICPSCHQATLAYQEGCEKCVSCDYSRC